MNPSRPHRDRSIGTYGAPTVETATHDRPAPGFHPREGRPPATRPRAWFAAAVALLAAIVVPSPAAAYRPFVSTDADVAGQGEIELEVGAFRADRIDRHVAYTTPDVVLNYGVVDRVELVGEFGVTQAGGDNLQLTDPEVSVKTVLREGVLQDKPGISLAVETALVLPSTIAHGFGCEVVGIASERLGPLTFHLNLGGGVDRDDANPLLIWGLITELPVHAGLRLVSEVNGESVRGDTADDSGLFGAIWQVPGSDVFLDVGARKGFSRAAADWGVTAGFTVAWSPFAHRGGKTVPPEGTREHD